MPSLLTPSGVESDGAAAWVRPEGEQPLLRYMRMTVVERTKLKQPLDVLPKSREPLLSRAPSLDWQWDHL
jgi:hypothetical protein